MRTWNRGIILVVFILIVSGQFLSGCNKFLENPTAPTDLAEVDEVPTGEEEAAELIGALADRSLRWRWACSGSLPYGAAAVGRESYGPALYLVRAWYGRGLHPGKIRPGFGGAYLPYGGREVLARCYQVFMGGGRWVRASGGRIPRGAIPVGREAGGQYLYAARAWYGGGLHPGKVRPGFRAAKIPYGGREVDVWSYEVLVSGGSVPSPQPTPTPKPAPSGEVRLSVPYKSQLDAACRPNNLCGYASTLMQTSYLHGTSPTTYTMQSMAQYATGSRCPRRFSSLSEYVKVAKASHLGNAARSFWKYLSSYEELKNYLRQRTPVQVALKYGNLGSYRCYTNFSGGHSVVVVGFSNSRAEWLIHDPYCRGNGAYRRIPHSYFVSAVRGLTGNHIAAMIAQK